MVCTSKNGSSLNLVPIIAGIHLIEKEEKIGVSVGSNHGALAFRFPQYFLVGLKGSLRK